MTNFYRRSHEGELKLERKKSLKPHFDRIGHRPSIDFEIACDLIESEKLLKFAVKWRRKQVWTRFPGDRVKS